MIRITSNINQVTESMQEKFALLSNPEYLFKPVLFGLVDLMTKRIHEDGIASDGSQIGTYSNGYLKQRSRANRKEGNKVIISLTRQLENDWSIRENSVQPTPNGYGIGFLNKLNYDKSQWVEATYAKPIFSLTTGELEYAVDYINELTNQALE